MKKPEVVACTHKELDIQTEVQENIEQVERKPGEGEGEDDTSKDEDGAVTAPGDKTLSQLLDF